MAETPSSMIPLGTIAPDFNLLDTTTHSFCSLQNLKSPYATVIIFMCNHCPYVMLIQQKLVEIANIYQQKGVSFVGICSNDVKNYPADHPDLMREEAKKHHYPFPYLYDETQTTAKAYHAACTPDLFVFDGDLKCVYRGRFDNATPGNGQPVTGKDLSTVLDNLLVGKPVNPDQKPSVGCNIKWKK